jgi:hypothetical protein
LSDGVLISCGHQIWKSASKTVAAYRSRREALPDDFQQKPGTLSRPIADQVKIDIDLDDRTGGKRARLWRRGHQRQLPRTVADPRRPERLHGGITTVLEDRDLMIGDASPSKG